MSEIRRNRFALPLAVSLLLHVLLLVLYMLWGADYFSPGDAAAPSKDIVVEFLPDEARQREIVEAPEHARTDTPRPDARLASDKNARAMDQHPDKSSDTNVPYSEGISDIKEIKAGTRGNAGTQGNPRQAPSSKPSSREDPYATKRRQKSPAAEFNKNVLLGRRTASGGNSETRVPYKQTESSARNTGGISFNTYAWDFAPYLIDLKQRIQRNIYPPPAFTKLGFGGENVLKFRIYPDGRLEGLTVLGSRGEKALVQTSEKAVQMSAPFLPLPDDFPEKYLEVTANFQYYITNY